MVQKITEVLGYISLGGVITLSTLKLIGNKWLETILQKNLEEFKNELKKDSINHQIAISNLYKDRAQATKEIFDSILKLESSTTRYTISFSENQLKGINKSNYQIHLKYLDQARVDHNDLIQIVSKNSIYFNKESIFNILQIQKKYSVTLMNIGRKIETGINNIRENSFLEPIYFAKHNRILDDLVISTKEFLESEFRKLIGVE